MPKDNQSIEDLMGYKGGHNVQDDTAQDIFSQKEKEIKLKQLELVAEKEAAGLGAQYINLYGFSISPEALALVEESEAKRLSVVCFYYDGHRVRLGTTDYNNKEVHELLKNLKSKYFCEGRIYLISSHSLKNALGLYKTLPKPRVVVRGINISEESLAKYSDKFSSFKDVQAQIEVSLSVSDIVSIVMAAAVKMGSTDVHIEGEEKDVKVRFRLDGELHDVAIIKKELWDKIILRLKTLTKVKINITNRPQDGRMSIFMAKERIDIRASFLPTNFGESVVMRLLRSSTVGLGFDDLGLRGQAYAQLRKEVERPNGMIVTTGPTGSGKTTTLYAILKKLNTQETKIITIEDPIEYQLEGVNQSQIGDKYSFAQGLRSIVRQDPDVIMVGEIRDLETAEISIQAALTGHLVLSTIHTNYAAGTVPRFLSMGVKPFLLAPAINAIIGQRLLRLICKECKIEDKLDEETIGRVIKNLEKLPEAEKKNVDFNNLKFYKGGGCEACQGIGFKGRVGIYEIMTINKDIEKVILSGSVSEYDMAEIANKQGMVTMMQDGILKALEGKTSVSEVFRIAAQKED